MYVEAFVYDGKGNNLIANPAQTKYVAFNNKARTWNTFLKLSVGYNQLSIDSYVKFVLYEFLNASPVPFGVGYISLYNKSSSTLRFGSQKVSIYTMDNLNVAPTVEYTDPKHLSGLEKSIIEYENRKFERVTWLDKMSLSMVELKSNEDQQLSSESSSGSAPYYLYVEFPSFGLPIVYSDINYPTPQLDAHMKAAATAGSSKPIQPSRSEETNNNNHVTSLILNSLEIPVTPMNKVYDPDFQLAVVGTGTDSSKNLVMDPIELKYHKLERNTNNNSLLDKELKPSPKLRDQLLRILAKPSNVVLTDTENNLIWKFRYYFSRNSTDVGLGSGGTSKSFLPKFLKAINWENEYELDHVFEDIFPNYWSVDRIQIGDALELLGSYFDPFKLASNSITGSSEDVMAGAAENNGRDQETKFQRVFKHVIFLRKFAVERLRLASNDELLLYLLQLVQALKYEARIYSQRIPLEFQIADEVHKDQNLLNSPLVKFLVDNSVENEALGNYFYWYVKVEHEDQLLKGDPSTSIYSLVLNKYIKSLKKHSQKFKLPGYKNLERQIWFIKKLTRIVELLRATFKRNDATAKKVQFLRDYLSDSSNDLLKFPEPFPLPLDPSVVICGCYPEECTVFKSSLAPLKITFKTIEKPESSSSSSSQMIFRKRTKHGKYSLMFKIGDDLRQDQLVIQIINLMDNLLKNENLDLRLTPYKILATSPLAGLIQFVENETLDSVLVKQYPVSVVNFNSSDIPSIGSGGGGRDTFAGEERISSSNGILSYLRLHSADSKPLLESDSLRAHPGISASLASTSTSTSTTTTTTATASSSSTGINNNSNNISSTVVQEHASTSNLGVSSALMDNYVKSCAGYCVITYILGVGDRHLDNLLLSPNGKFWHADFGYILGRDPKPFPPLMKLPMQVIDGMGGLEHENYNIFKSYCFLTYTTLRKNSNLILNLFQLMVDANIPDIKADPYRAVEKVQEKFGLEMSEEEAIIHFQNLISDSVSAVLPVVIDRLHSLAQYWRA
ncbi:Phosphatidylinositol (PI) 3-kinase [Scheffersomyces spartinae]|uniref:Phosphatidylinositol 3-kinase VPS34 n=1 Tax=Scheffersomyces spartinae TaxID=45513 RepID=A0A9P8AI86_9ASCO|nr:Phosphatidylinositol (PI) 3-kinase [Scheffersomyces spartinae]KAG7193379.1 Phosphatidylinositol (PI) 3-kinase [Scheffersomyces spartinae]